MYVANTGNNTVSVINTKINTVTAAIVPENISGGVAVTPNGKSRYLTNWGNNVCVIDTATNTAKVSEQVRGSHC